MTDEQIIRALAMTAALMRPAGEPGGSIDERAEHYASKISLFTGVENVVPRDQVEGVVYDPIMGSFRPSPSFPPESPAGVRLMAESAGKAAR